MSVSITSSGPCACCQQGLVGQTMVGTNSKIGFNYTGTALNVSGTFATGNFTASYTGLTASGAGVGSLTGTWDMDVLSDPFTQITWNVNLDAVFVDPLFSWCSGGLWHNTELTPPGVGNYSFSVGPIDGSINVGESSLTTDSSINGAPVPLPLLSNWVFGITAPPDFILVSEFVVNPGGLRPGVYQNTDATPALITNVVAGPAGTISYASANTTNPPSVPDCPEPSLGGDGSFSFVAVLIPMTFTGLTIGQTYTVTLPVASRVHGTTNPFVAAGNVVNTFVATGTSETFPFQLGWPLGFGHDVQPNGSATIM